MAKVKRVPGPGAKILDAALKDLSKVQGKVGWFASAHYPDGTPVAYVAAIQEFGWPEGNIPPRLGMRETAREKRQEWAKVAENGARRVMQGKATALSVMELLGLKAAGDIRKHIAGVTTPPLKVATVKARLVGRKQGRFVLLSIAKPLVDTGHMLATLTNTVEKK